MGAISAIQITLLIKSVAEMYFFTVFGDTKLCRDSEERCLLQVATHCKHQLLLTSLVDRNTQMHRYTHVAYMIV